MKIGALIVTTGLPHVSGVTALLSQVGSICAGQRMISTFQCAGVSPVALVVGPEDKKSERKFVQPDVVFLRCEDAKTDFFSGLKRGIAFMQGYFDRVLLVPGDTPLFLPQTVRALCRSQASIAVPVHKYVNGFPVALDKRAMDVIVSAENEQAAKDAVTKHTLEMESIRVDDPGILLRGEDMSHRKALIEHHSTQLSRPVTEVALYRGSLLYDPRLSTLLHLVEYTRSVQDACSLMQMSYSTAWNMLNHVEDELGFPLVVRNRGGASGSGTLLTENGKRLMDAYDQFSERLKSEADLLYRHIFSDLTKPQK